MFAFANLLRSASEVVVARFYANVTFKKGLLIHRKRSPFPDKGRLVDIDCASDDLLIIVYKQIKMHRTTKRVTLSLPL